MRGQSRLKRWRGFLFLQRDSGVVSNVARREERRNLCGMPYPTLGNQTRLSCVAIRGGDNRRGRPIGAASNAVLGAGQTFKIWVRSIPAFGLREYYSKVGSEPLRKFTAGVPGLFVSGVPNHPGRGWPMSDRSLSPHRRPSRVAPLRYQIGAYWVFLMANFTGTALRRVEYQTDDAGNWEHPAPLRFQELCLARDAATRLPASAGCPA